MSCRRQGKPTAAVSVVVFIYACCARRLRRLRGVAASAIHANTAAVGLPCRLQDIFDYYGVMFFNAEIYCHLLNVPDKKPY
jgi:hypothetical protein